MGNCSKLPRTSSNEEIKLNANPNLINSGASNQNPGPGQAGVQSNPNNSNHVSSANPNTYNNHHSPSGPPNPPNRAGHSGYPPNYPTHHSRGQAPPGSSYSHSYQTQSIPISSSRQLNAAPTVTETKSIVRFSRIIDESLFITKAKKKNSWVNFRYKSVYPARATIHYFVREGFDRTANVHYFYANTDTFPKAMSFDLEPGENVEFVNKYWTSFRNVPAYMLDVQDKLTYPIVVEIECRSRDNPSDEQVLINCYKIAKEGKEFTSGIVKQIIRINGSYKILTNFYGTSTNGDESECLFCLTEMKTVAVLPCRHVVYCATCMKEMMKKSKNDCPICRTSTTSFLKVNQ